MAVDDATDAAAVVESGDEVVVDTAPPRGVLAALADRSNFEDVDVYAYGFPYRDRDPLGALARTDGVDLSVSLVPPALREFVAEGSIAYRPRTIYAAARSPFRSSRRRRVALMGVSRREPEGYRQSCLTSFGRHLAAEADVTVAEVDDGLPPDGSKTLHRSLVDADVDGSSPQPLMASTTVTDVTRRVASEVAQLLPPDPTLQLGVGAVPRALGDTLGGGNSVDVWTGLVSEAVRQLDSRGCIGNVVGGVAIGDSPDFYDWLADATGVELVSPLRVHSPRILAERESLVAINSALQVDLQGQVNAESIGRTPVGGVGGQPAFMTAASGDPDGLAVVGLPSRTPNGTPRIVRSLGDGPVTTPRHAVDVVVTEHGVADLRGTAAGERPDLLGRVAHPDDRDALLAVDE